MPPYISMIPHRLSRHTTTMLVEFKMIGSYSRQPANVTRRDREEFGLELARKQSWVKEHGVIGDIPAPHHPGKKRPFT